MALAGDISLNRGNRDSAKNAMKACKEWLELGANVMIFPEGTRYSIIHSKRLNRDRSRDGKLGEFKEGAFRLAIETKADILPLAVAGTNHSIPVHSWKMAKSKGCKYMLVVE
jgi:1-acyl-sn-glycerol-3-phosphate acyltransferase